MKSLSSLETSVALLRAHCLQEFAKLVPQFDVERIDDFRSLLRCSVAMGFQHNTLADKVQVSGATVGRWLSGFVVPHPIMRRAMATAIAEEATKIAEEIEKKYTKSKSKK